MMQWDKMHWTQWLSIAIMAIAMLGGSYIISSI